MSSYETVTIGGTGEKYAAAATGAKAQMSNARQQTISSISGSEGTYVELPSGRSFVIPDEVAKYVQI